MSPGNFRYLSGHRSAGMRSGSSRPIIRVRRRWRRRADRRSRWARRRAREVADPLRCGIASGPHPLLELARGTAPMRGRSCLQNCLSELVATARTIQKLDRTVTRLDDSAEELTARTGPSVSGGGRRSGAIRRS